MAPRGGAAYHIALLRGINVGGKNKLPMTALAEMFAEAGCVDVQTYIQSGNVVFCASDTVARRVPALIAAAIAGRFHIAVPLQTRSVEELREVAQSNPILREGVAPDAKCFCICPTA